MTVFFVLLFQAVLFLYWKIEINHNYTVDEEKYQGVKIKQVITKEENSWYIKFTKYDASDIEQAKE